MYRKGVMRKALPTIDRVREVLSYDPETGDFRWKVRCGKRGAGRQAGCLSKATGYVLISVDGTLMTAHRLAWFHVHGEWPQELDHCDNDRSNNCLGNLRLVTRSQIANAARRRSNTSDAWGEFVCL